MDVPLTLTNPSNGGFELSTNEIVLVLLFLTQTSKHCSLKKSSDNRPNEFEFQERESKQNHQNKVSSTTQMVQLLGYL